MTNEKIKQQAFEARRRFQAGEITYGEAKKLVEPYRNLYNQIAEKKAAKFNMKPSRFRIGDFLKMKI